MHRNEMDVRFPFDQGLRAVSVVDIPVRDEHSFDAVFRPRVVGGDGHIAKETKTHGAGAQGVVARRPHRAKAPFGAAVQRHIHGIEGAPDGSRRGVPRAGACDGIGIEMAAAGIDDGADTIDVWGVMCERQLFPCRVASLDMDEGVKELGTLSQSARNRS
jgi:hypothetical protein